MFTLRITNPWASGKSYPFFDKDTDIKLSTNKSLCLQTGFSFRDILCIEIDIHRKQDHAGVFSEFALFGFSFIIHFYDVRHWNYEEERFMTEEEVIEEEKEWREHKTFRDLTDLHRKQIEDLFKNK